MTVHISAAAIRPAAVLPVEAAAQIVAELEARDVSRGGVWNATAGVWQRYDRPWTGPAGSRGGAELVGSIAVIYDRPRRHEITLYKVTLTTVGREQGFTADSLCDNALGYAGLSLATCPRAEMEALPGQDPFAHGDLGVPRQRSLSEILNTDVLKLVGLRKP
ncbi:MAG TPA: hypothetical protein VNB94_03595 [Mycobacteriales bacterium]|nr:hypothetical protein [Mycobacteriales bacterium]